MHYLVEDPTYPLIAIGLVAMGCLIALQVTQQGKFLIWAVGLLGVGVLWFGGERLWVTDAERIEAVVYELANAVANSDIPAVEALLTPEVTLGRESQTEGIARIQALLPFVRQVRFDFLKIRQLTSQAGSQTKRGSAEFKVTAGGVVLGGPTMGIEQPFPATNTQWSLGFREVSPQVWRVTRITAISVPRFAAPYITGGGFR